AAQTTANYIAWFISSCAALVSVGATALVARFIGGGDLPSAVRTTNQSILLALVIGIVGTPLLLAILPWGIHTMRLEGETAESAGRFLRPILTLITCQLVTQAGIACLVGAGDTRTGPVVLSGVAMLNIPLAWACFHGFGPIPAMDFFGIGVGTATSHAAGSVAVLAVLVRGRYGMHLRLALLIPDFAPLYPPLRLLLPPPLDPTSPP